MKPSDAPGAASYAIRLDAVTRRFVHRRAARWRAGDDPRTRDVLALDSLTLTLDRGRLMGVLGPNGAGKTTLLRILCALLAPSSGTVDVLGYNPSRDPLEVRARIGAVLGGERAVYWRLTGEENLLYGAALHGIAAQVARARAAELLQWVGLVDRAHDLVEEYSSGMRLRLGIARALMHDPPLLILDEPTSGLDPHAAHNIGAMLRELCAEGRRSIVVATHNMAEAERLCDIVAVLDRGRMIAFDSPAAIAASVAQDHSRPATLEAAFLAMTTAAGGDDALGATAVRDPRAQGWSARP
jgi:ABC-2 type transport system ATP-binding protein